MLVLACAHRPGYAVHPVRRTETGERVRATGGCHGPRPVQRPLLGGGRHRARHTGVHRLPLRTTGCATPPVTNACFVPSPREAGRGVRRPRGARSAVWNGAPCRSEAPLGGGVRPGAAPAGAVSCRGDAGRRRRAADRRLASAGSAPGRGGRGTTGRTVVVGQHGVGGSGGNCARSASVEGGGGRRVEPPYIQETRTRPCAPGASGRCGRRPWTTEEVEPCVRA